MDVTEGDRVAVEVPVGLIVGIVSSTTSEPVGDGRVESALVVTGKQLTKSASSKTRDDPAPSFPIIFFISAPSFSQHTTLTFTSMSLRGSDVSHDRSNLLDPGLAHRNDRTSQ